MIRGTVKGQGSLTYYPYPYPQVPLPITLKGYPYPCFCLDTNMEQNWMILTTSAVDGTTMIQCVPCFLTHTPAHNVHYLIHYLSLASSLTSILQSLTNFDSLNYRYMLPWVYYMIQHSPK